MSRTLPNSHPTPFSVEPQRAVWPRLISTRSGSTLNPVSTGRSSLKRAASIGVNQRLEGFLSKSDRRNPLRKGSYADDYVLTGLGQRLKVVLKALQFDPYLQIISAKTGRAIAQDDDSAGRRNAQITFTARANQTYYLRVTSYASVTTGRYTLSTRLATPEDLPFNPDYGYGLLNAAAAVAQALGQPEFADAPNHGNSADLIKAPEVWAMGISGQSITVAVLDTGVDYTHVDLFDNIWVNSREIAGNGLDDDSNGFIDDVNGWDFVDGDRNPIDVESHGTHVSGIIAATNNGIGVTGIAYSAKIMPLRVITDTRHLSLTAFDTYVASGIRYAIQNGAKVINLSLGSQPSEPTMASTQSALQQARAAGVVVVMAAGNDREGGATQPIEPALFSQNNLGIAVGAIDDSQRVAYFSNPAGQRMDFVVAPGVDVHSTIAGNQYASWSGTSMAAAYVTGVVALLLSANPTLTPDQVEDALIATANPRTIRGA
jgi:subtilisin family serine protease